MEDLNRIELIGYITEAPTYKPTDIGTDHARFMMSVKSTQKTNWFRIVAFGPLAREITSLEVNQRVRVIGEMQIRLWTDPQGRKHNLFEVILSDFNVITPVEDNQIPTKDIADAFVDFA